MIKKIIIVSMLILMCTFSVNGKGNLSLSGNFFNSADNEYTNIYGKMAFFSELTAEYNINSYIFLWAGFGFLSKTGTTFGELLLETKSKRSFLSAGAGYKIGISNKIDLKLKAGISNINSQEEAMKEKINSNTIGLKIGSDVLFHLNKNFFIYLNIGYFMGNDTIEFEGEKIEVKLSGLSSGIGIGIEF